MNFYSIPIILIFNLIILNNTNAQRLDDCYTIASKVEKEFKIPNKLLSSISFTETGITKNGIYQPWPWSLNVNGKSIFFDSKKEMTNYLDKAIYANEQNIDIGCMQLNYRYHGRMFKNLKDMIDPEENIYYAGRFLKKLFLKYKSWNLAISRYHSSNPKRMKVYLKRVHEHWKKNREGRYNQDLQDRQILSQKEKSKVKSRTDLKIMYFKKILQEENS